MKYIAKILKTDSKGNHFITLYYGEKYISKNKISNEDLEIYFEKRENENWYAKPAFIERMNKSNKMIDKAVSIMGMPEGLKKFSLFEEILKEYCKEFNCDPYAFVVLVKQVLAISVKKFTKGDYFKSDNYDIPEEFRVKNKENLTNIEKESIEEILKGKGVKIERFK